MKTTNLRIVDYSVSGISESLKYSGLPMNTKEPLQPSLSRGKKLGKAKVGSGHDCFLKGITVNITIEAFLKFWDQWARYSFQDVVSSNSQMHKLDENDLDLAFTTYTDPIIINRLKELKAEYEQNPTDENYRKFLDSVPQGYLYTRNIVTNYLQLKTMYFQRRHHKLEEWRMFCRFCEELPLFKELIGLD